MNNVHYSGFSANFANSKKSVILGQYQFNPSWSHYSVTEGFWGIPGRFSVILYTRGDFCISYLVSYICSKRRANCFFFARIPFSKGDKTTLKSCLS